MSDYDPIWSVLTELIQAGAIAWLIAKLTNLRDDLERTAGYLSETTGKLDKLERYLKIRWQRSYTDAGYHKDEGGV